MIKLTLALPIAEEEKLRVKARSMGLSLTGYASQILRDSLRQESDPLRNELLRAMQALVPTLAEAFGRTQNVSRENIEKLTAVLLERYEKSR